MRIITNTKNTILSPISTFAFSFIKQLRETIKYTICNTSKFVEEISKIKIDNDDNFISLDVQDLFTNIPVTRAVDIAINKIGQSEKFCTSNLTITDLKQILLLSLNNSYCQFNGRFYRQKQGLPMGNTLSPILADLYMNDYIEKNMENMEQPLRLWRYVDDILMITKKNEDEIKLIVERLNKIRSKIRFTHEYETNGSINFLDTTLSKTNNGNISIRWYRKDTAADRLLNYNSHHHKSIKINIIKNMTAKIIETSKDTLNQQEDLNKLRALLIKSNYPNHIIEKYIRESVRSTTNIINNNKQNDNNNNNNNKNNNNSNNNNNKMKYQITLPFVNGIEILKRKLEKLNIKVFFSYPKKIKSACTNPVEQKSKSNIYQINCNCGAVYNGETKIGLKKRLEQHKKRINKKVIPSDSEIVQHHHDNKYQCMFDLNKAFVIDNEIGWKKRRIKEAIYSTINNSINRKDDINTLWLPLLNESSTRIKSIIEIKSRSNTPSVEQQDGDSGTAEEE
jgi:predicted GIY-YIG superfamily endonuclease